MGLSGFLYVAIVVGWAVYLVPFALKRYDEAARNRSIDRFSSAMRVLGRREHGSGDASTPEAPPAAQAAPPASRPVPPDAPIRQAAARTAARRRRRMLLALLLATSATGGTAAFGVVPPWAVAIPGTLMVLWLVMCRRQARRASAHPRAAQTPAVEAVGDTGHADQTGAAVDAATDTEAAADADVADEAPSVKPTTESTVAADDEPTVVLSREDLAAAENDHHPGSGSLWDPVPVTLPTYVHKPRAPRTIRTIDLGAAGVQTSGRADQSSAQSQPSARPDTDADHGSDQPAGPSRRAVGQ